MCSFVKAECQFKLSKGRKKSLSMAFLEGSMQFKSYAFISGIINSQATLMQRRQGAKK